MAKKWIQEAIKTSAKGALRKTLGTPKGKDIPIATLDKAAKSKNPTTKKRAILAKTLRKMKG